MDKKKIFYFNNPDDVSLLLQEFDDEMAENSDVGGDSDADDNIPLSRLGSTRSSSSSELGPNAESDDESEIIAQVEEVPKPRTLSDLEDESASSTSSSDEDVSTWTKRASHLPPKFSSTNFDRPFGTTKYCEVEECKPLNFFMKVLSSIFLRYIIYQSNLYASQNHNTLDLTIDELKVYLGILIIMGFHKLPSMRLYWSSDPNFGVRRIQSIMPLKRFLKITRFLHLNDNKTMPKKSDNVYDKLYKIRPILDYTDKRFKLLFHPSRFLSIDESMVKYKGRSVLKQYMPMKPIKRGFKIWVIACAVTGYCVGLSMYEGAEKVDKKISLGERVVNKLTHAFEGLGYCLFFDNFFASITLVRNLLRRKLFACATLRPTRRYFPKNLLKADKTLKTGEIDFVTTEDITISKWKDRGKKAVNVISTMHKPDKIVKVLRTQKDGTRTEVDCPESVAEYNRYMGGVDKFDQLLAAYPITWKSKRWWLRVFYYCIDASIVNSYILYKTKLKELNNGKKPLTHLQFRSLLANELIGSYSGRVKTGPISQFGTGRKRNHPDGRATLRNSLRLNNVGKHLPIEGTRRRCAFCSTTKEQKRSTICCQECTVALCLNCFVPFHKSN